MLRCVIVDDSPVFLTAARSLLEREGASVVAIALTSEDALRQVGELRPDVTLLDINLADESGFELAERLYRDVGVEPGRIILISTQAEEEYAELISESPVAGFMSKSALSVAGIRGLMTSTD